MRVHQWLADAGNWFVLELCEPLDTLVDLTAEFHGYDGDRMIITIITTAEKSPHLMGFRYEEPAAAAGAADAPADEAPVAPEDELAGVDIDIQEEPAADGRDIQGNIVLSPERGEHIWVNGVEIFKDTALATMRQACSFYGISSSGSKQRCFSRLFEYQKRLELQSILGAAREAELAEQREPRPQPIAELPGEETQLKHQLTHTPYMDWCEHCMRTGQVSGMVQ